MVLQHLSHYEDLPKPPSKNTAVWDLMRERGAYPPKPTVQRPACPACGKRSLTARKRTVDWRCIACHLEFDNPVIVDVPVDSKTGGEKYALYRNERQTAFQEFKATHDNEVEKLYQDELAEYELVRQASYDKYTSGEGTITFCKKCAYLWDVKGMELCDGCRKHYHLFRYDTCYACLPQARKEDIPDYRAFEAEMDMLAVSINGTDF